MTDLPTAVLAAAMVLFLSGLGIVCVVDAAHQETPIQAETAQ